VPHSTHSPCAQIVPAEHFSPLQHCWFTPPHASHRSFELQTEPALQLIEEQQVCEVAPQGVHSPSEHRNPSAHWSPGQHICSSPPQLPQVPFSQASASESQLVPQQVCPVPPQGTHLLPAEQTVPASLQGSSSQQASPSPPQDTHVPPSQSAPVLQLSPQHGWSLSPHATHSLFEHVYPLEQAEPASAQHG
jgi:hypothetical protein